HQLLARQPHRHGSQFTLRRARDHGIENLLAPDGVAELDLSAPQRSRRERRAAPLRHRPEGAVRYDAGVEKNTAVILRWEPCGAFAPLGEPRRMVVEGIIGTA